MAKAAETLVRGILDNLSSDLRGLRRSGHFSDEWLLDGSYNRGSWLHARLWGALVRAVPKPWVVNIEARVHTAKGPESSFKPDVQICDDQDHVELVVELESSNSSDDRVVYRDIERLKCIRDFEDGYCPKCALLLTVLPSQRVKNLRMWGDLDDAQRGERRSNPFAFHRDSYIEALERLSAKGCPFSVAWANLDVDGIRLEFWDGTYQRRPFWPTA